MKKHWLLAFAALALAACNDVSEPEAEATPPVAARIQAPAGEYTLDPHHSSLFFSVRHLGVSNYLMRFTDFDVNLDLRPDQLSASSVQVSIDPASIRTDYSGDYAATHPDSPFASWDESLAQSENFLHAGEYPVIHFSSTAVKPAGDGTLSITGDLTLRGQTLPVTLTARVVGSQQAHPFTGVGLIGFSAEGSFKRSDFGLTHLVDPPIVGDTVTLRFEGELLQQQGDG